MPTDENALERTPEVPKVHVFGIAIDALDRDGAVTRIIKLAERRAAPPVLVVTPNLDHVVRLRDDLRFGGAYAAAEVVLADGFPLVLGSWLSGTPLPERVAGADLVRPLAATAAANGRSIFVLGTTQQILAVACRQLQAENPGLIIAGTYSPSRDFGADHPDNEIAIGAVNNCRPDLLFVALGSPRQELWAASQRHRLDAGVILCVGAAFDFIAGHPPRAPVCMRRLCLEWFWRLVQDPPRLIRRYAVDLARLPVLLAAQIRHERRRRWLTVMKRLPALKTETPQ